MHSGRRAWLVCAGATLLLFTSTGLLSNAFTVFQPYIMQRGAMTESQGSLLITIRYLTMLLSTMAVTTYYRRFPLRWGMVLGLVPGAVSLLLYSAGRSFALCCGASALSGVTCGLCGMVPATMLLDRWLSAIGVWRWESAPLEPGAAAVVASPVAQGLVVRFGLSGAMLWMAAFFLAAGGCGRPAGAGAAGGPGPAALPGGRSAVGGEKPRRRFPGARAPWDCCCRRHSCWRPAPAQPTAILRSI